MADLKETMQTTVFKTSDGSVNINMGHVTALALGMGVLYLMIPERKRKMAFKK